MDKLVIKTNKSYRCGDTAVRIPVELSDKVKEIAKETNRDMKSIIAEMIEFCF